MNHSIVRTLSVATAGIAMSLGLLTVLAAAPASASTPVFYYAGNAGYQVSSTTIPPATAKAEFLVPTVTCTKAKLNVTFGVLVENTSGGSSGPVVAEGCAKGKATYAAYIEINGTATMLDTSVSPNNLITVSASEASTATSATFTDVSSGYSKTLTGAGSISEYASVGSFPGTTKKVPTFSTFNFTNAEINGAAIGTYTGSTGLNEEVQTINGKVPPKGKVEIQPGALGTSSFPLSWVSN
jgi:hypothetical protein